MMSSDLYTQAMSKFEITQKDIIKSMPKNTNLDFDPSASFVSEKKKSTKKTFLVGYTDIRPVKKINT